MDPNLIVGAGIKLVADLAKDAISKWLTTRGETLPPEVPERLNDHAKEIVIWSTQIQFYGMSAAKDLSVSIPLGFSTPRRYGGEESCRDIRSESSLLTAGRHILLLGAPGSGKTTTLKRLAGFLLTEPGLADETPYQFPLVLRLAELQDGTIYHRLTSILGISSAIKRVVKEVLTEPGKVVEVLEETKRSNGS